MKQLDNFLPARRRNWLVLGALLLASGPALAQQHPTASQFFGGWHKPSNDGTYTGPVHTLKAAVQHTDRNSTIGGILAGGAFTAPGTHVAIDANPSSLLGSSWLELNGGVNGTVFAVAQTVAGDSIYVGGSFTTAGGVAAQNVALWTAGAWQALGAGANAPVRALALRGGRLYVGGDFTQAGGTAASYIASWRKATGWATLGSGVNAPVYTIEYQGNNYASTSGPAQWVYVGGDFTQAGGAATSRIALWRADSGLGWQVLGTGPNGRVLALNNGSGSLVVGGDFTQVGSLTARHIAQYESFTATWKELGGGTNGVVRAIAYDGRTFVGGDFTEAGGLPAARIGMLDSSPTGTGWYRLDDGLDGPVRALTIFNHELLVGGDFQHLGDGTQTYSYLARYAGNRAPGDPLLSNNTVAEHKAAGTQVGQFGELNFGNTAASDIDGDPVAYKLVPGIGGDDNGKFYIDAVDKRTLRTVDSLDFTIKSIYSIRVQGEDIHGVLSYNSSTQTTDKIFTISIIDGPDYLKVSSPMTKNGGSYLRIAVTAGGVLNLTAPISVETTVAVATGGQLATSGNTITGPGSFILRNGATLGIGSAEGISTSGSTGDIQMSGSRSYSPDASYEYVNPAGAAARQSAVARVTGSGLPTRVASLAHRATADVTLTNPVEVTNELLLTGAGHLQLNGLALKLPSTAAGTAQVLNTDAGRVRGNTAQQQRYLDASLNAGLGYRQLSSPIAEAKITTLGTSTFVPVVNPLYNSAAAPSAVTPFPTVYGYDESRQTTVVSNYGAFDKGWYSPTATGSDLTVGRGYTVNITGGQTLAFTGTLNQDDLTLNLTRTNPAADGGWQLLGNPFPSALDWQLVTPTDRPGLDGALFISQSTGRYAGQYRSYVNGIGGQQLLAAGQGFFARVSTGNSTATLTLRNAARVSSATTVVQRTQAETRPLLALELSAAQPNATRDVLYLYAQPSATAGFDSQLDAAKLPNATGMNLAALTANGQALSIQGLTQLDGRLPLRVQVPAAGTYRLALAELLNLPASTTLELEDTQTGQRTPLTSTTSSYTFTVAAGQNPDGRFWLNLRGASLLAAASGTLQADLSLYPNPAHETATLLLPAGAGPGYARVVDALGRTVREQPVGNGATTLKLTGLPAGVYTVQVQVSAGKAVRRLVID